MGAFKQLDIDFGKGFEADRSNNVSPTQELVAKWDEYASSNRLNPKTKRYAENQHAFLWGIGCALQEKTPMLLSLCMVSGRDIASLRERTQPR
jgi:hypothetical protein